MARKWSSATALPTCTRASTSRHSQETDSASTTAGRRSTCRIAFGRRPRRSSQIICIRRWSSRRAPRMADFFAHESCYVDEGCEIGAGTKIWHFSHVMPRARIGRGCTIGQNVVVSPDVVIGDNVRIQNNVSVYTGVVLEDEVFCGPSMVFTNVVNPRSHIARKDEFRPTLVKRGATLGANSTVVCGHTIGRYAFVGAGAVVTKDVPDYGLVVGNPGRIAGWACSCGVKLASGGTPPADATCAACGISYRALDGVLTPMEPVAR